MQECKALGAARVIVVGRGAKLEKARELGADVCIDFEKEDPVQRVLELTNGIGADEVMECSGAADSPMKACKMARKTGKVALIATYHAGDVMIPANTVNFNELTIVGSKANPTSLSRCCTSSPPAQSRATSSSPTPSRWKTTRRQLTFLSTRRTAPSRSLSIRNSC